MLFFEVTLFETKKSAHGNPTEEGEDRGALKEIYEKVLRLSLNF